MKTAIKNAAFFLALYLLVVPQKAEAYLDPGTGSYVLQVAAAALFGGAFIVKTWWRQIKHLITTVILRKEKTTSEKSHTREK